MDRNTREMDDFTDRHMTGEFALPPEEEYISPERAEAMRKADECMALAAEIDRRNAAAMRKMARAFELLAAMHRNNEGPGRILIFAEAAEGADDIATLIESDA